MSRRLAAALLLASTLASASAFAADTAAIAPAQAADARAIYQRELAVCNGPAPNQGRATCLKEANAAYAQNRHAAAGNGGADYKRNASRRCDAVPGPDGDACRAMMAGHGSTSGSVAGGGILRELVTPTPAASSAAADAKRP